MAESVVAGGEFRVGSVLGRSFSVFFRNFVPFSLLSIIVLSPTYIYAMLVDPAVLLGESEAPGANLLVTIIDTLLSYLVIAAMVYGTFQDLRGRRASLADCFSQGISRMFPAFGVAIVVGILTGLAMLAFIIPGLIVATMLWVAVPAAVIEREGLSALSRSSELTKGYRWKVAAIVVLFYVISIAAVVGVVFVAVLGAAAAGVENDIDVFTLLALLVFTALFTALSAVVSAVGYHDLRVAKEGVDVEQIASVFD